MRYEMIPVLSLVTICLPIQSYYSIIDHCLMLYITLLSLSYVITGGSYLLIPFTDFTHSSALNYSPPAFWQPLFVLCICEYVFILFCLCIWDSTYRWDHTVFVFLWLISLSVILSRLIYVVANGKISFFMAR